VFSAVGLVDRGSADSACRDPSKQHTAWRTRLPAPKLSAPYTLTWPSRSRYPTGKWYKRRHHSRTRGTLFVCLYDSTLIASMKHRHVVPPATKSSHHLFYPVQSGLCSRTGWLFNVGVQHQQEQSLGRIVQMIYPVSAISRVPSARQRVRHRLHKDRQPGHTHAVACNYDSSQHPAQTPKVGCQNAADPLSALSLQALLFVGLGTAAFGRSSTAGLRQQPSSACKSVSENLRSITCQ